MPVRRGCWAWGAGRSACERSSGGSCRVNAGLAE